MRCRVLPGLSIAAVGVVARGSRAWRRRPPGVPEDGDEAEMHARRARLVEQVRAGGVADPAGLAAMRAVPRHRFVPPGWRHLAYEDIPLPIGAGQSISQPSVVALMTAKVGARPGLRVLEVGTVSGDRAAVLAECVGPGEVDTIETVREHVGKGLENAPRAFLGRFRGENFGKLIVQVGDDPTKTNE